MFANSQHHFQFLSDNHKSFYETLMLVKSYLILVPKFYAYRSANIFLKIKQKQLNIHIHKAISYLALFDDS